MSSKQLVEVAQAMVAEGKGILAIDESTGTIAKRLQSVNLESSEENRRAYRDMLLTTPGLGQHISGAILYDETLRQSALSGRPFTEVMTEAGIMPGIKVDTGAHPLAGHPDEKITEGLDGLRGRLEEYVGLGAKFAKWRAVITIGGNIPTSACVDANAHALARYAALCQEAGVVPMVEPEVLMDGSHSIDTCYEVTEATLRSLFTHLYEQKCSARGHHPQGKHGHLWLRSRRPGGRAGGGRCHVVLSAEFGSSFLAGVVFLSGGQSDTEATAHLDAMNRMGGLPWPLSFSYGRALQAPSLARWGANPAENVSSAQALLAHRARMNGLATLGQYEDSMEQAA